MRAVLAKFGIAILMGIYGWIMLYLLVSVFIGGRSYP